MPTVKSLSDLKRKIGDRINGTLAEDIVLIMAEEMRDSIQKNVYDVYQPDKYERRYADNGLIDEINYEPEIDPSQHALYLSNRAQGNDEVNGSADRFAPYAKDLDTAITYGWGLRNKPYNRPRPFIEPAQEALKAKQEKIKRILCDRIRKG